MYLVEIYSFYFNLVFKLVVLFISFSYHGYLTAIPGILSFIGFLMVKEFHPVVCQLLLTSLVP